MPMPMPLPGTLKSLILSVIEIKDFEMALMEDSHESLNLLMF
jgi:hypothetical protein